MYRTYGTVLILEIGKLKNIHVRYWYVRTEVTVDTYTLSQVEHSDRAKSDSSLVRYILEHTYIRTYIHTNTQTHKHTNIQTYKHTNIQTYKHTINMYST